jgi:hypothetical protein
VVFDGALGGRTSRNDPPERRTLDTTHIFPSFEADHMGISVWRGKLNKSSGKVLYDKTAGTGTVEIVSELASVDFGMDAAGVRLFAPRAWKTADRCARTVASAMSRWRAMTLFEQPRPRHCRTPCCRGFSSAMFSECGGAPG